MSRVFGGCRTLMAAAKASTAKVSTAKASTAKVSTAKASTAKATRAYTKTGIQKPVPVSPQLGEFLGTSEAARTEVTKKIWDYIKLHNLQNPANKREVNVDAKLKTIFPGKDTVTFGEIAKLLSLHFVKSG